MARRQAPKKPPTGAKKPRETAEAKRLRLEEEARTAEAGMRKLPWSLLSLSGLAYSIAPMAGVQSVSCCVGIAHLRPVKCSGDPWGAASVLVLTLLRAQSASARRQRKSDCSRRTQSAAHFWGRSGALLSRPRSRLIGVARP